MKSVRIQSFSGPYFLTLGLKTDIYSVNLRIHSEHGKIPIRKTLNTGTFYAVAGLWSIAEPVFLIFPLNKLQLTNSVSSQTSVVELFAKYYITTFSC